MASHMQAAHLPCYPYTTSAKMYTTAAGCGGKWNLPHFPGAMRPRVCNTVMDLHGACAETVLACPGGFQTGAGHLAGHKLSSHK